MTESEMKAGERVALAQRHQLNTLHQHLGTLHHHADALQAETAAQAERLADIDRQMAELYAAAGLDRPDEATLANVAVMDSLKLAAGEEATIRANLPDLSLALSVPDGDGDGDWATFMAETDAYVAANGIDLSRDPMEQLLPPHRAAEVCRGFDENFGDLPWDQWDWTAVTAAVLAGALLDYFIVATPRGDAFRSVPQRGSPVTEWMREQSKKLAPIASKTNDIYKDNRNDIQNWIAAATTAAEERAKVAYDRVDPKTGLTPKMHRLSSLGHSPLLGLVFGVLDILSNTCTFIDDHGRWQIVAGDERTASDVSGPSAVLDAMGKVILHGFSDIFTPQGLPAPFLSELQMVQMNSGFVLKDGGDAVSVTHLTRYMYAHGYDMRHFMTMAIVPAMAELMIHTYHAVRTWNAGAETGVDGIRGKMKLGKMLALTHALLASSNIVKTALYGWNPTAVNLAQHVAMAKQMLSLLKLSAERDALVEDHLAKGWQTLLADAKTRR